MTRQVFKFVNCDIFSNKIETQTTENSFVFWFTESLNHTIQKTAYASILRITICYGKIPKISTIFFFFILAIFPITELATMRTSEIEKQNEDKCRFLYWLYSLVLSFAFHVSI